MKFCIPDHTTPLPDGESSFSSHGGLFPPSPDSAGSSNGFTIRTDLYQPDCFTGEWPTPRNPFISI
jgi:hypothetical protein